MGQTEGSFPIFDHTVLAKNPDFAAKIGLIVEAWTFIERGLRDILTHTLGCRMEQAAALLYSQRSMSGKLALTKAVVQLMPEHKFKADLLELIDAIGKRAKVRNKIVHGQYVGGDGGAGSAVVLLKPVEGPFRNDSAPLPIILDNHARDLRQLMDQMKPFILFQPDGPERLPVIWRRA
jgi:hypothetical protein